ncbi:hypothetical protein ACIBCS_27945 [Streptomyces phaeochromogenes]|uniref:hypothetical protein n=1 Tax=Streptomyces phaeochromogenes TaxID=1923 RepID=UPI003402CD81
MNERRPGDWPVNDPADLDRVSTDADTPDADDLYVKRVSELARRELVLGSIRANLLEQPTPNSVLAVTRHWISDITAIGDEVAKAKRRST